MKIITWDQLQSAALPPGWDPVPYRLTSGALISCPFDGRQPYIVKPRKVNMQDNIAWAVALQKKEVFLSFHFQVGTALAFAKAVGQSGLFDYQRPPKTDLFLTFYTSFASYNFGVLGYYAGFSLQQSLEGGGYTNWLHATEQRLTNWGRTTIDTSGRDGTSRLNEWCIRRAFQDIAQKLIP